MDIASLNLVSINSSTKIFDDVVRVTSTYSSSRNVSNVKSAEFIASKSISDEDALQAVKLDPAVLEAKVRYKTMHCDKNLPNQRSPVAKFGETRKLDRAESKHLASFEDVVSQTQAALLSLTPQQYELLLAFVDTLRRQRTAQQRALECAYCKKNGESLVWYSSHALKDWRGRVLCPVLRARRCPRCGACGDRAHTLKYCNAREW